MKDEVVIVGAGRTPVGSFNGSLSALPAHELGTTVIKGLLERTGLAPEKINEVIFGNVLTAGQGQNPTRQAAIHAGLPVTTPAWTINMVCGSGLRTVALGARAVASGDSEVVIAGGRNP